MASVYRFIYIPANGETLDLSSLKGSMICENGVCNVTYSLPLTEEAYFDPSYLYKRCSSCHRVEMPPFLSLF